MRFIKLTDAHTDRPIWVNMALVTHFYALEHTRIGTRDSYYDVKETPEAIMYLANDPGVVFTPAGYGPGERE